MKTTMKTRRPLRIAKVLLMIAVGASVLGLIVMQLWNALIPSLFGGPAITFWQSLGLFLLSHLLLGGGPGRYGGGWGRNRWRKRFDERWERMTPEEREKFRGEWRHHCGSRPGENASGNIVSAGEGQKETNPS